MTVREPNPQPRLFSPPLSQVDWLLISLALMVTVAVLGKDISVGGLRWGDTAVHAMDGVLIHDWVMAGPSAWVQPMQFAEEQYGHYPCLGIGRHYPPGFAIVEAGFFAVFGISPFTARLCVVFFGLLAAAGTYLFMRTIVDRPTSLLAAVTLLTLPAVTLWGRQAMLEVPTLAVLAWGAVAFSWYVNRPTWRRYGVLLIVATAAILFRQTGVFLHSAIAMALIIGALRGQVRWSQALCSAIVAVGAIVVVTLSFEGAAERMFRGRASYPSLWDISALTFYLRQLPDQVGWVALLAALVGVITWPRKWRAHGVFLACWLFVGYVMLSAAELKWPRFFFVALFPFAAWTAVVAGRLLSWIPYARLRPAVCAAIVVGLCATGFARPTELYPDCGVVIAAHRDSIDNQVVLVAGTRDNHLVFAIRQHLPWRRAVAIRSSKLLYTCNTVPAVDFVSYANGPSAVADIVEPYAFARVFMAGNRSFGIAQEGWLREYLEQGGAYRAIASHHLHIDGSSRCRDETIDVYEPAQPLTRTVDYFDIPIPRSDRTIRIDLRDQSS
ncbi:MAG: glycosyltransferase family 39 protein [Planctomycetes bacterium]|nr:glycosyltransferase family 39 protein [Planctomycetota bacterium]